MTTRLRFDRRRAAGLALALLFAVLGVHTLGAYTFWGSKWPATQVFYYVNPVNLDVPEAEAEAAVRRGADAWTEQSQAGIVLTYAGRTSGASLVNNGRNEVFFRNETNGSTLAVTYSWWDGAGNLLDSDIIFYDGGFRFFTGTGGCSGGIYIEDGATHEFGHVLGLGHSTDGAATMYPTIGWCSQDWRSLAADDIAGIEALYPAASTTPPAAPSNVAVTGSSASPSSALVVSWSDNCATEDRFRVERSADGVSWALAANASPNQVSFTDTGLAASTTYSYRVRSENTAGWSAYAGPASGSTQAPAPTPPGAPAPVSPANGATSVSVDADLAWSSTGATTYDVYFGTSSSPGIYASNLAAGALALPTMPAGVRHYWKVVAKNANGTTTGAVWSFTTKAVKAGGKPRR